MSRRSISPVTLLLTVLAIMGQCKLFAVTHFQIQKQDVETQFGHLLTDEERKAIHSDNKNYMWPVEDSYVDSFEAFLQNKEISFKKQNIPSTVKGLEHFTQSIWGRFPTNIGLPDSFQALIDWENNANEFTKAEKRHAPISFRITHYEIPFEYIEKDIASNTAGNFKYADKEIFNSLVFTNDQGIQMIRWPIQIEDTKFHPTFEKYLKANHIPFKKGHYFYGFLTASRSMMAMDPITKKLFSLKTSTDCTGGWWTDKPMKIDEAKEARFISDYVYNIYLNPEIKLRYLIPLPDSMAFMLPGSDEAFMVREYKDLNEKNIYYLPGFSAQHSEYGAEFAHRYGNAQSDSEVEAFWRRYYNVNLAKATAEFIAYTGFSYDSAHSQQYLVELDADKKPTGKIIYRDLGDTYALVPFFKTMPPDVAKRFTDKFEWDCNRYALWVPYGIFKTQKDGSKWMFKSQVWEEVTKNRAIILAKDLKNKSKEGRRNKELTQVKKKEWKNEFFTHFENIYELISGVGANHLRKNYVFAGSLETYKIKKYKVLNAGWIPLKINQYIGFGSASKYWKPYFNISGCFQGARLTFDGLDSCHNVLKRINERMDRYFQNNNSF